MGFLDYSIIIIVLVLFIWAVMHTIKLRKNGGGCSGNCSGCSGCGKGKK